MDLKTHLIDVEENLGQLGIELPPACTAAGMYRPAIIFGNMLIVSGHTQDDAVPIGYHVGKVGTDVTLEQAQEAARDVARAILSSVKATLHDDLSRVKRLFLATGLVRCDSDFTQHVQVMNGFSELMSAALGKQAGIGARSVTGASSLPGNVCFEVSLCIFELHPES
jgi:enamine deaminase RidA (YjgF/YER057c/UK114 family)